MDEQIARAEDLENGLNEGARENNMIAKIEDEVEEMNDDYDSEKMDIDDDISVSENEYDGEGVRSEGDEASSENTSIFEDEYTNEGDSDVERPNTEEETKVPVRRSTRENAGTSVARLHPYV